MSRESMASRHLTDGNPCFPHSRIVGVAILGIFDLGVSIKGVSPKWLVNNGKSENNMDENWGYHHFRKPPYIYTYIYIDR
jgi:hypothetical protein